MYLLNTIGKKIVAVKSNDHSKAPYRHATHILFDDKETYIELSEQDCHTFHDCASSARHITLMKDATIWKHIMENYPDANCDI